MVVVRFDEATGLTGCQTSLMQIRSRQYEQPSQQQRLAIKQ